MRSDLATVYAHYLARFGDPGEIMAWDERLARLEKYLEGEDDKRD